MASFLIRLQRLIYRNRSITFTPTGTRFILLTLAVGMAAINTGNNLLYLILGMMLSLIIISGILSEQSLRKISVDWRFPARIFARQPVPVEMRITNGKRFLPSFSFRVDEGDGAARSVYFFKLPARQTTSSTQTTRFERRGLRTLPPLTLRTTFPFGFFNKSLIRPRTQTVLVYPRILPMPPGLQTARARAGQDREDRRRGSGAELHNLRDYTPSDDARGIHWKASARESKLLLKEYEREEEGRVLLCLSNHLPIKSEELVDPSEQGEREGKAPRALPVEGATQAPIIEDFERAVVLSASLARELDRRGCAVGLQTLSEESGGLDAILKTLALIQPIPSAADPALLMQRIAEIARAAADGGRRILILPFHDPAWDKVRGSFSDVLTADEPRFIEWAGEKTRTQGPRS
ncbi:MAG: DUF58 domain-containing protein [Nitrospirae bacterium]|nr:DUF58 domain-containing protein [Nitrospirota bacterium]